MMKALGRGDTKKMFSLVGRPKLQAVKYKLIINSTGNSGEISFHREQLDCGWKINLQVLKIENKYRNSQKKNIEHARQHMWRETVTVSR